jgi:hypothetical protein
MWLCVAAVYTHALGTWYHRALPVSSARALHVTIHHHSASPFFSGAVYTKASIGLYIHTHRHKADRSQPALSNSPLIIALMSFSQWPGREPCRTSSHAPASTEYLSVFSVSKSRTFRSRVPNIWIQAIRTLSASTGSFSSVHLQT